MAVARSIIFSPNAWEDYMYWQRQDSKTLRKINALIEAVGREPFTGIGKPEPLKDDYAGFWSRRIDEKNRLVYEVRDEGIRIAACRYHYGA